MLGGIGIARLGESAGDCGAASRNRADFGLAGRVYSTAGSGGPQLRVRLGRGACIGKLPVKRWPSATLKATLVLALAIPVNLGCNYIIQASARNAAKATVPWELEIHVQQVGAFLACLQAERGVCEPSSAESRAAAAPDFFSAPAASKRLAEYHLLDTTTESPIAIEGSPTDKAQTSLEDRDVKAVISVASFGREVLNDDFQKKMNAIFNLAQGGLPENVGRRFLAMVKPQSPSRSMRVEERLRQR